MLLGFGADASADSLVNGGLNSASGSGRLLRRRQASFDRPDARHAAATKAEKESKLARHTRSFPRPGTSPISGYQGSWHNEFPKHRMQVPVLPYELQVRMQVPGLAQQPPKGPPSEDRAQVARDRAAQAAAPQVATPVPHRRTMPQGASRAARRWATRSSTRTRTSR